MIKQKMKSTVIGLSAVASAAQAIYLCGGDQFSGNLLGKLAKFLFYDRIFSYFKHKYCLRLLLSQKRLQKRLQKQ